MDLYKSVLGHRLGGQELSRRRALRHGHDNLAREHGMAVREGQLETFRAVVRLYLLRLLEPVRHEHVDTRFADQL